MDQFLGEYYCAIDTKARILLPVNIKKQLSPEAQGKFAINRGFEQCLVLYPMHVWTKISAEINQLNIYVKKNRDFVRYFYRGATEITLDSNSRLLLPRRLLEYAEVNKRAVLFAYSDRIELWAVHLYEKVIRKEPEDFSKLAEEVMGRKLTDGEKER